MPQKTAKSDKTTATRKNPNRKNLVVTGVTRGLGKALLDGFSAEGHTVIGCGRNESIIKQLQELYPSCYFEAIDVKDDLAVRSWANRVLARFGAPDFLINNAALINQPRPLWELGAEEFDELIDVNIKGPANTIRHFLPAMIEAGRGVVVNFSSAWGRSVDSEVAPYCASKWAIEGLTKALALELPDGLSAVPLNPGVIHTEMLEACFGSSAAAYQKPQEWAEDAVSYILSLGRKDNGKSVSV